MNQVLNLPHKTAHVIFINIQPNDAFEKYMQETYTNVHIGKTERYEYYVSTTTYDKHYDILEKNSRYHAYVTHDTTERMRSLSNTIFLTPLSMSRFLHADVLPFSNDKKESSIPIFIVQGNLDASRRCYDQLKAILDSNIQCSYQIKVIGRGEDEPAFLYDYGDKVIVKKNLDFIEYHREMQDAYGIFTLTSKKDTPKYYTNQLTSTINYARGYNLKCIIDKHLQFIYDLDNTETYTNETDIVHAFTASLQEFYNIPKKTNVVVERSYIDCQDNWSKVEDYFAKHLTCQANITFVGFCEMHFYKKSSSILWSDWVGIIHDPWNTDTFFEGRNLLQNSRFLDSLWCCRGLFCMSSSVKDWVMRVLNPKFFVEVIYHPLSKKQLRFWNKDKYLDRKRIFQIGNWLRVPYFIFNLRAPGHEKHITPFSTRLIRDYEHFQQRDNQYVSDDDFFGVEKHLYVDDDEYNNIFETSIVALKLYASTCNNIIIECIKTNCPILVNRLPEIEDYLGKDYPFFYDSMEEATEKLNDTPLIIRTHHYLSNMNKSKLMYDNIVDGINKCLESITSNLPYTLVNHHVK